MSKPRRDRHEEKHNPQELGAVGVPQGAPRASASEKPVKRKNIIGTSMPYVPPAKDAWTGSALGYRPKPKKSRPVVQPNRI